MPKIKKLRRSVNLQSPYYPKDKLKDKDKERKDMLALRASESVANDKNKPLQSNHIKKGHVLPEKHSQDTFSLMDVDLHATKPDSSNKSKQIIALAEIERIKSIQSLPSFQLNPIESIRAHLLSKVNSAKSIKGK